MNITADKIKASVAEYYRYKRGYAFVAFEADCDLLPYMARARADVLIITKSRYLIEVEVKLTMSDLRKDQYKPKHRQFKSPLPDQLVPQRNPTHWFYFAVPKEIANKAVEVCEKIYPYAGVIGTDGVSQYDVVFYRKAKSFKGNMLTFPQILRMCREQSGTLCSLAR